MPVTSQQVQIKLTTNRQHCMERKTADTGQNC